jgi:hypothetical protein
MHAIRVIREPRYNTIDTSAYPEYLDSIRDRLPAGARAYAGAPWHYDFRHDRCVHDANVLTLTLSGASFPENDPPKIPASLELRLMGSHRNGIAKFSYSGLAQTLFRVTLPSAEQDFGDVLVDEISLNPAGLVVHEVVFEKATLIIEAADVEFAWEPLAS